MKLRKLLPLLMLAFGWSILSPTLLTADEAMTPPPVPDQIKKLWPYVGEFKGTGTQTMGGKTMSSVIHHRNTKFAEGYGVEFLEDVTTPGYPTYHAINILGYDDGTSMYHLYTVDNYGDVHDHKGVWSDAGILNLKHEGIVQGKPFVEDLTFTPKGPNEYFISGKSTLGGEPFETFQGTLKRVGSMSKSGKY